MRRIKYNIFKKIERQNRKQKIRIENKTINRKYKSLEQKVEHQNRKQSIKMEREHYRIEIKHQNRKNALKWKQNIRIKYKTLEY